RVRGLFGIYQENRRLEQENARLLQWQQVALKLTTENRQLQGLLKVVPDRAVSYVTARVIANSGGAYVRTVMINSGTDGGLARGQAAITGYGLVGDYGLSGALPQPIPLMARPGKRGKAASTEDPQATARGAR